MPHLYIISKEHLSEKAQQIFAHDEMEIIDGCRVLSSVIGSESAVKQFVEISLKQQKSFVKKAGRSSQCFILKCL